MYIWFKLTEAVSYNPTESQFRSLAEIRQRRRAGGVTLPPPGQTLLRRPPPHGEDPRSLVPGAVEEVLQAALQPLLLVLLSSLAQGEDAGGHVAASLGSDLTAVAAQQLVETAGARGRHAAALGRAVSVAGQLGQKQHQHQGQNFLLDTRDRRCSGNSGASLGVCLVNSKSVFKIGLNINWNNIFTFFF